MKRLKKYLFVLVLAVLCICPVFAGCDLNFLSASKLDTPKITLSSSNNCITWSSIKNAESYLIYANEALVDEIKSDGSSTYIYEFRQGLQDVGDYSVYVLADSSSVYRTKSSASNVVNYKLTAPQTVTQLAMSINQDETNKISFTLNDTKLSYVPLNSSVFPSGAENIKYYVFMYSNSSELVAHEIVGTEVDLRRENYIKFDEIYALRLGYSYVMDGQTIQKIASDIIYYNPDDKGTYTKSIYLFDGFINDMYIENLQELDNVIYYSFINRLEDFTFKISDEFKLFVNYTFDGFSFLDRMHNAIAYAFDQMYETIYYTGVYLTNRFCDYGASQTEIRMKISYGGFAECDTSVRPNTLSSVYPQDDYTPYYEQIEFESLEEKYGNSYKFESDSQYLYQNVTTSEQLYWAVENKVTPVFTSTSCTAYRIYKQAKGVLKSIVSDDMTDYEKALSIFDWICVNTSYDYTSYSQPVYSATVATYPTIVPSYFLEGVFQASGGHGYSVCDGFSKAYSLMCNMIGIDCIRIVGDAYTGGGYGGHAWNKVLVDIDPTDEVGAQYYLADITWTEFVSNGTETAAHIYFGLSDEDVKDTHIPYKNRQFKFGNYKAENSMYYYVNQKFTNNLTTQNLVAKSTQELSNIFDYMFNRSIVGFDFVADYNFMVAEYEKVNEKYLSKTTKDIDFIESNGVEYKTIYDWSTDTMSYFKPRINIYGSVIGYDLVQVENNYKLRGFFLDKVMRNAKFQEQLIGVSQDTELRPYDSVGNKGLVFVVYQKLLIDADGEVEHLISALNSRGISGTYTIYVLNSILTSAGGESPLSQAQNLFGGFITGTDLSLEFKTLGTVNIDTATARVFSMKVVYNI